MTALAGFWNLGGHSDPLGRCRRMLAAQRIYAPDPEQVWAGDQLAIGRRLFRLLPEDVQDRGPVIGHGGSSALVADIRIDNRDELCRALGVGSAESPFLADSALLMRAWEQWEEGALQRIVGDFAFALWEGRKQRLVLARDYVGQRPLHFSRRSGLFAFASMPKGLHALEEVPRSPDLEMATEFTALMPEAPGRSFFEGVERVSPGHLVVVTADRTTSTCYWRPDLSPLRLKSPREYEEALREQIDVAVAASLRGVKDAAAAHLSAGLDSSAVASTAARLMAPLGKRVVAYTSAPREGYEAPGLGRVIADEAPLAASVAALYPNMDHVVVRSGNTSPVDGLDRSFFLYDRPVLNPCNSVWINAINDAAKARRLNVLLTGQMGNMSFSYPGMTLLPRLLSSGRLLKLARLSRTLASNGVRWGTIGAQTFGPYLPRELWVAIKRARGKTGDVFDYTALRPEAASRADLERRAGERSLDFTYRPRRDGVALRLWVLGRHEGGNYNKGTLAGWGIDRRDPTADRRLMEFCLRVPDEQYLAEGLPRALARRAFADRLPHEVVGELRKGYQFADWHEAMFGRDCGIGDEVQRIAATAEAAGVLDARRMASLAAAPPAGGWHDDVVTRRYRLALLRGLSVGHFIRKAAGSNQ